MRELLFQLIQSPSRENYLAIRASLVASDSYEPYSDEMEKASQLYELSKFEEARDTIRSAIKNLILSPRAHQLLALLLYKLGDTQASQMEMMIGSACIEGILATGDGSEHGPYIVARTSDEYDVIEHHGKQLKQQSLMQRDGKYLDLIECTDGSEFWFDITDAYNRLSTSFKR